MSKYITLVLLAFAALVFPLKSAATSVSDFTISAIHFDESSQILSVKVVNTGQNIITAFGSEVNEKLNGVSVASLARLKSFLRVWFRTG
jgi:hypothetical protein